MNLTPEQTALVERRLVLEREWCYELAQQRYTVSQIAALSMRPVEAGGIGRALSPAVVRTRIDEHRAWRGDATLTREALIERQAEELDELGRYVRSRIAEANEKQQLDVHATKLLLEIQARESKLHGLDAPTKVEAEVVHRDAVMEELSDAMKRAGLPEMELS